MRVSRAVTSCSGPSGSKLQHLHAVSNWDASPQCIPSHNTPDLAQWPFSSTAFHLWFFFAGCQSVISNDASASKGYQSWPGEMLNTQDIHTVLIQPAGRLLYIKAKQATGQGGRRMRAGQSQLPAWAQGCPVALGPIPTGWAGAAEQHPQAFKWLRPWRTPPSSCAPASWTHSLLQTNAFAFTLQAGMGEAVQFVGCHNSIKGNREGLNHMCLHHLPCGW